MADKMTTFDFVLELFKNRDEKMRTNHLQVIDKISMNTNIDKATVATILGAIPFVIKDSLEIEGDVVVIKNVGTWSLIKRQVNNYLRNSPQTKYVLSVSAKTSRKLTPYRKEKRTKESCQ